MLQGNAATPGKCSGFGPLSPGFQFPRLVGSVDRKPIRVGAATLPPLLFVDAAKLPGQGQRWETGLALLLSAFSAIPRRGRGGRPFIGDFAS